MQECWNLEKTWENIFGEVFRKLVHILCIPTFSPSIIAKKNNSILIINSLIKYQGPDRTARYFGHKLSRIRRRRRRKQKVKVASCQLQFFAQFFLLNFCNFFNAKKVHKQRIKVAVLSQTLICKMCDDNAFDAATSFQFLLQRWRLLPWSLSSKLITSYFSEFFSKVAHLNQN